MESEIRPFSSGLYPQQESGSEISPHLSGIRRSIKSDTIFCKVESEIHLFSSGLYPQQELGSETSPHLSGISPDYKI